MSKKILIVIFSFNLLILFSWNFFLKFQLFSFIMMEVERSMPAVRLSHQTSGCSIAVVRAVLGLYAGTKEFDRRLWNAWGSASGEIICNFVDYSYFCSFRKQSLTTLWCFQFLPWPRNQNGFTKEKRENRIFGDWPNGKAPRSGRGI